MWAGLRRTGRGTRGSGYKWWNDAEGEVSLRFFFPELSS